MTDELTPMECPDCEARLGSYDMSKPIEHIAMAIAVAVRRHGLCVPLIQHQAARVIDPVKAAKQELESYV